jgi:hypothetical protein
VSSLGAKSATKHRSKNKQSASHSHIDARKGAPFERFLRRFDLAAKLMLTLTFAIRLAAAYNGRSARRS